MVMGDSKNFATVTFSQSNLFKNFSGTVEKDPSGLKQSDCPALYSASIILNTYDGNNQSTARQYCRKR